MISPPPLKYISEPNLDLVLSPRAAVLPTLSLLTGLSESSGSYWLMLQSTKYSDKRRGGGGRAADCVSIGRIEPAGVPQPRAPVGDPRREGSRPLCAIPLQS